MIKDINIIVGAVRERERERELQFNQIGRKGKGEKKPLLNIEKRQSIYEVNVYILSFCVQI